MIKPVYPYRSELNIMFSAYHLVKNSIGRNTKTMVRGGIECGRWGVGRAGESNAGKMGTTVTEQQ